MYQSGPKYLGLTMLFVAAGLLILYSLNYLLYVFTKRNKYNVDEIPTQERRDYWNKKEKTQSEHLSTLAIISSAIGIICYVPLGFWLFQKSRPT